MFAPLATAMAYTVYNEASKVPIARVAKENERLTFLAPGRPTVGSDDHIGQSHLSGMVRCAGLTYNDEIDSPALMPA
jgi:hypothetical protein